MNQIILILTIILLTHSCSERKANNLIETQFENDSISKKDSDLKSKKTNGNSETDFQQFWSTFRQAVIKNDTNKIITMTIFPFETRGEMDEDPIVKYDSNKFFKVFRAYLSQSTNWIPDDSFISSFEEIKRIKTPDSTCVFGKEARIGNLVFKFSEGHWKLVFAFLNIRDENLWKR